MTSLISAEPIGLRVSRPPFDHVALRRLHSALPALSLGAVLAFAALPLTHDAGGRHSWQLATTCLLAILAVIGVRPWRAVSSSHLCLAVAPFVASVLVGFVAPTGFSDLELPATFGLCAAVYLSIHAFARTDARRSWLLLGVAAGGIEQMTQAWWPWWGGQDASRKMVGTFFWHNQFAAYVAGITLATAVATVWSTGRRRYVFAIAAALCPCGVLFSASRSTMALLVAGWLVIVARALFTRSGRLAAMILPLPAAVCAFAMVALVRGSGFDGSGGTPVSALQARNAAESVSGNGEARLAMWRAGLQIFSHHVWTGGGLGSFRGAAPSFMPAGVQLSDSAHNAYLQAFSDGGLLLGLAVCVPVVLLLWRATRVLLSRASQWPAVAAALGAGLLIVHAGVDMDWNYPALLVLASVLSALLPHASDGSHADFTVAASADPHRRLRSTLSASALVFVLLLSAAMASRAVALQTWQRPPLTARALGIVVAMHGTTALLPSSQVCADDLLATDAPHRTAALTCTRMAAADDAQLQVHRAYALALSNDTSRALALASSVDAAQGEDRPGVRLGVAQVRAACGDLPGAVALTRDALARARELNQQPLVDQAQRNLQVFARSVDETSAAQQSGGHA